MRKKAITGLFATLAASLIILAVFIMAFAFMKFWNGKQTTDGAIAAQRIANDMSFMQNAESVLRVYQMPASLGISVSNTTVTVTPTICNAELGENGCFPTQREHHVPPEKISIKEIPAEIENLKNRFGTRTICLMKRTSSSAIELCTVSEGCCSLE